MLYQVHESRTKTNPGKITNIDLTCPTFPLSSCKTHCPFAAWDRSAKQQKQRRVVCGPEKTIRHGRN